MGVVVLLVLMLGPGRRAINQLTQNVSDAAKSSTQPLPAPETYLASSSRPSIVFVRVPELLDGRLDSFGPTKQEIIDGIEEGLSTGLELRDIQQMYLAQGNGPNSMVAILRRPVETDKGSVGADVCETYKDFTIFETPEHDFRFYPHPRMVVQSDDLEWMQYQLDSMSSDVRHAPLPFPSDCQVAVRSFGMFSGSPYGPFGWNSQWIQGIGQPVGFQRPIAPPTCVLAFGFVAGRVDARLNLEFFNAADATEFKSRFDSGISMLRQQLAQRSPQANQNAAEERMRNALLATNMTVSGNVASFRFSLSAADLASQSTAQAATPARLPGQKKPKPTKEPFVTVRVNGVPSGTDENALVQQIYTLAGGVTSSSAKWQSGTVIVRLGTTVSPEDVAKRMEFGEVTRVKGRGVTVAADPVRLAALPKPKDAGTSGSKASSASTRRVARSAPADSKTLLAELESANSSSLRDVAKALAKLKPDENQAAIARQLEALLSGSDSWLVEDALDALVVWGDKESVSPVHSLMRTTSWPSTKSKALKVVVTFADESAADAVVECIEGTNSRIEDIRGILEKLGPGGEKAAVKILSGSKAWVFTKRDVASFLESFAKKHTLTPETVAALLDLVRNDHDHDTVRPLIGALGTVKEERVADFLATGLDDFWYSKEAKAALIAMGPEAEKSVAKYLKHQKPEIRFTCCEILSVIGTKKSVSALRPLVANNPVGQAAKDAIDAINQRAKQEN